MYVPAVPEKNINIVMERSNNRLPVAVGLILQQDKVLLAQKSSLYYEFPGGKVEQNEEVGAALIRELQEEIGIVVLSYQPFMEIKHNYVDKKVHLFVHKILQYQGVPLGLENQTLHWVKISHLLQYKLLEANYSIAHALIKQTGDQAVLFHRY